MAIPKSVKRELEEDETMKQCAVRGCKCIDLEWHHVWMFGGKQIQETWAIVALCKKHHRGANGTITRVGRIESQFASIQKLIASGFKNLNKYQKPMDKFWENHINYFTKHYVNHKL